MALFASKGRSYFRHRVDHGVDFGIAHGGKKRQGESALVLPLSIGQVSRPVAETFLIKGMQVQRNEMDAGPDSPLLQLRNEAVAVNGKLLQAQAENIKMPRALAVRVVMRH